MNPRTDIATTISAANPISRAEAARLLSEDVRRRLIEATVLEPVDAAPPSRPRPRTKERRSTVRRPTLRIAAIVVAICLVLASTLFTAPGRAVTNWIGDQLGFAVGQPGGHPSLRRMRHFANQGTAGQGRPAYVLAVGPTMHGNHYEFIVYHPKAPPGKHWQVEGPCFELDLPQERSLTTQGCGILPEGRSLYVGGGGGNSDPDQEIHYLAGRTSMAVRAVEVHFEGHRVPVELKSIPAWLIRRLHLGQPFKFFFALVPNALAQHGGEAEVTALGAHGETLGEKVLAFPDPAPMYRFMCHDLEHRAHQNPGAVADCRRELGPRPW